MEQVNIQYCSDLHLEFPENKAYIDNHPIEKHGDILILAGDIVPFAQMDDHKDFFNRLSDLFESIYWVPGNHEYYYSDVNHRSGTFTEKIRSNITLLNNSIITHQRFTLICSTLWTHISALKADIIGGGLTDFFVIDNGDKKLSVADYNQMHMVNLNFLKNAIEHSQEEKTIVITHHVPTFINYPPRYASSPVNEAFAVELENMIQVYQPQHWIYGHSHINTKTFSIGKTQLLTNQLGYIRRRENVNYRTNAILTI